MDADTLFSMPQKWREHSMQVSENHYHVSLTTADPPSFINHSCGPNAGFDGQIILVAMRDICKGDEITFDYAMCDSSPFDEFDCSCGSVDCRGRVTGNDWRSQELWLRYRGYFSPYLNRRIQFAGDNRQ